jgi:hypothetical protein
MNGETGASAGAPLVGGGTTGDAGWDPPGTCPLVPPADRAGDVAVSADGDADWTDGDADRTDGDADRADGGSGCAETGGTAWAVGGGGA